MTCQITIREVASAWRAEIRDIGIPTLALINGLRPTRYEVMGASLGAVLEQVHLLANPPSTSEVVTRFDSNRRRMPEMPAVPSMLRGSPADKAPAAPQPIAARSWFSSLKRLFGRAPAQAPRSELGTKIMGPRTAGAGR